jgi:2-methylcitrate dehydratase PrpD
VSAASGTLAAISAFVAQSAPPPEARRRAAAAVLDTVGVMLAGASEPAARIVQAVASAEGSGPCGIFGTALHASASHAALANGTAAHALDYDDMCFVSLAHPSAPLVAAAIAAAEVAGASGAALLDGYVVGFEVEGRLGRVMNPAHYERGWHCTSTIGTVGAAAAAARILGLDAAAIGHALAIAASEASGLKENFGTMVKPLHAGLAARNAVLAVRLAAGGLTASAHALDGAQGFLAAMDSAMRSLDDAIADFGERWEIVDTGITVKLYPACAGTHPTLDALLDLRRTGRFAGADVDRIEVIVDSITPTVLIHDRPASGLEAKFSMPFCAAAAVQDGRVGIDTFGASRWSDPEIVALMARVSMRVDPALDGVAPPLTQARILVRLKDGRELEAAVDGARGYPEHPASDEDLAAKFFGCAERAVPRAAAEHAIGMLRGIADLADVRSLSRLLAGDEAQLLSPRS